ncbi:helix-turn-helix transcriptional regulator [Streptomyces sp. HSW2009]|uniref:helix-turn-helix domain-containing protein n=1 Tax=Streptomyces sp. HSW2009 TaxID=3142890 RepID=UPI0032EE3578
MKRKPKTGHTTSAQMFGELLRQLRERAGMTQDQLAAILPVDRSLIAHMEAGKRRPDADHVEIFDKVLNAGGLLVKMWERVNWFAPHPAHPDWFKQRAELDARAVSLCVWQTQTVPGLLQTADYARALLAREEPDAERVEAGVLARLSRQERFLEPDGPALRVVMDACALHAVVGDSRVMRRQCAHLLRVPRTANVVIQLLPGHQSRPVRPTTSLSLITLPKGREVLYSESVDRGHFIDDPAEVRSASRVYDELRAEALTTSASAALISEAMEGFAQDEYPRTQRGDMAQEQLQRQQRRRLHRGSPRIPQRRPRS